MIYIVEDDASIRELEQYALQTNQYTVRGFEDGASFWAAVRETVPDLVILDVMLPDEDGYQILGRLRETAATRTVPVIMVTAKTSEIDVVKGLDHGADDYLCKPFGIMEFISRVKAVLRRSGRRVIARRLSPELQRLMDAAEEKSTHYDGCQMNLCINYGGRDEILHAVRRYAEEYKARTAPEL